MPAKRAYPIRTIIPIALNEWEARSLRIRAQNEHKTPSTLGRELLLAGSLQATYDALFPTHAEFSALEDARLATGAKKRNQ